MQDVVDSLYSQYNENISYFLSKDEFYQYFHNLLETGTTYCQFFNRKLVKEVDETWVEAIEKAIAHLQFVIDHPRTFIEEDRQVVNVALAKKFTSETVKHLSMHSEMVDRVYDDGSVEPNKVLNVFKEESINTYENRFIYTLMLELRSFVNKRTDVIFERSKNEDGVKLQLDSVIDNYTEVITYQTNIRIQEKQTDLSNDEDNLNIFSRISNLHKKVNDLGSSGFMMEMSKYPLVKYPVVKTNAIAKNEHYKACYDLWNFIRSYDKVGYKVEMLEQDPTISQSFENDIYNMILLNYAVVRKQMTIKDIMNIDKPAREKSIGVNMIKRFVREVVNEYDMSESELKRLLLSELAQAEKEKSELIRKKEELAKRAEGIGEMGEEDSVEAWEELVENREETTASQEEKTTKKLSKKQLARIKREKREQEKQQKLEEDKRRMEQARLQKQQEKEEEERQRRAQQDALEQNLQKEPEGSKGFKKLWRKNR